jgi:hypothetical protein
MEAHQSFRDLRFHERLRINEGLRAKCDMARSAHEAESGPRHYIRLWN